MPSVSEIGIGVVAGAIMMALANALRHWLYHDEIRDSLPATIRRSRRAVKKILSEKYPDVMVWQLGAVDIDPKHLALCVDVAWDRERDALREDIELDRVLREAVRNAGYPETAISEIHFDFQSVETIDRDFGGNSFYARK